MIPFLAPQCIHRQTLYVKIHFWYVQQRKQQKLNWGGAVGEEDLDLPPPFPIVFDLRVLSKPLGVADIHSESSEKLSPRPSNARVLSGSFYFLAKWF